MSILHNLSHAEMVAIRKQEHIYFITGLDASARTSYYYLLALPQAFKKLQHDIESTTHSASILSYAFNGTSLPEFLEGSAQRGIDLENYGRVLASGLGDAPLTNIRDIIASLPRS